ncbi:MAG: hypothetical protein U0Q16_22460 [Bryobacteraceae bacterium]
MPQAVYILFGAAFTAATSFSFGKLLLRRLRLPLFRQEEYAFAFLLGSACLSWIIFALASVHLLYKGMFVAIGAVAIAAAWRSPFEGESLPPLPKSLVWMSAPLFAAFGVLCFAHAMAPEMSPDGTAYHLGLVGRYYRERGFSHITTNMYANLSQGVEMLFVFAWAFGKGSAAALTHLSFLFALAWSVLCYGRRFGFPHAGMAAALIVFVTPVIGIDAASAYIDLGVAAVIFGLFYLVHIWDEKRTTALVTAIGVLAGFAFAIKYTAFLALPYAMAAFVRRRAWSALPRVALAASLWIAPWMIKNAIVVDNPVSPFANRIFRNPYIHVSFEEEYRVHMRNYDNLRSYWDIPLELTVRGHVLCGLLGPLFLLTPLALVALRKPHGARLVLAAAVFGSVYATNIGTRFLIPAVPFIALALALTLERWRTLLAAVTLAHAVLSWPDILKTYCATYAWRLDRIWYKQALRIESEEGFLTRMWPNYVTARMIEQYTPANARVLSWNQVAEAYSTRDIVVPYQSAEGAVLGGIFWTPMIPEYQPTDANTFALPGQPVRRIRVRQTATGENHFTVCEMRLLRRGREIPRAPTWRLRAWTQPWDVQLAFDNSPVTRWSSWERIHPGMYVEMDLDPPVAVDTVSLEMSNDQSEVRLALDWEDASGRKTTIDKPVKIEIPAPLALRREATAVLKSRGITHLSIADYDFGAKDVAARQQDWGVSLVGRRNDVSLYAID